MAAQDAELKLKVSLDLAFFRQQLAGLGQASAGYVLPVNIAFNRKGIQDELNALQKNIAKREYRLTIQTNLDAEIDKAKKLAQAFADLEKGAFVSGQPKQRGSFTKTSLGTISPPDIKKLYKAATDAGLLAHKDSIASNKKLIIGALYELGEDSVAGLLNGLKSDNEKLKAAAKSLGKDLITSIKGVLGIASPSKEFKKIGEDSGEGFEQGLKSGLGEATRMGIKEMRELFRALQGEAQSGAARLQATMLAAMAGIVQLPGGRQQRGRLAQSASAINTAMTGAAAVNIGARQAGVRRQAAGAASATPAFMTALPMMFGMSERELMSRLQGLYGQQYRAPSVGGAGPNTLGQIIQSLAGARGALGTGGGLSGQLFAGGAVNPGILSSGYIGRSALSPKFVNYPPGMPVAYESGFAGMAGSRYEMATSRQEPKTMGIFAAELKLAEQAVSGFRYSLNKQQLMLPAAGQTGLGAAQAARVEQAYARSAERGASVMAESASGGRQLVDTFGLLQRTTAEMQERTARMIASVDRMLDILGGPDNPPDRNRLALPPAGGSSYYGPGGRGGGRGGGGYVPPGGFPSDGSVPPAGQKSMLSLDYYKNAFKYAEALKVADASVKNFSASQLPLIGGIKGVAGELAMATQQVLLYGTAYKALAFITGLPGQLLNAAKSQQQYNNALQTATQDTGTFAKELLYVDNVQRAFGLNLQTTRDGFTKLYASMAPTGFDSGSIEKLFTGISAATAALQLTPDKAERVIYAFGQMASKGQIMSEELKGQLGDVLPGALAIFAKAAGMSVREFSKAMEDGEFVGNRFREVFAKVSDELMNRFGTGAQAAGKSLQGLLNTVQGDFKRTLESFSPLADAAAQAILGPLGRSLKQVSKAAQIATGEVERTYSQLKQAQQDVGDLKAGGASADEIKAAEQNVAALTARYEALRQAAQDPVIAKQAQDIQKFTQELAKAGTFIMNVTNAIGNIFGPILNALGTNLTSVISTIVAFYTAFQTMRLVAMATMGALLAYRAISTILGFSQATAGANALSGAFNALGVATNGAAIKTIGLTTALRVFAASTIIGAIVGGIMLVAGAFASMRDRANESRRAAQDSLQAAKDAATQGGTAMVQMQIGITKVRQQDVETAVKLLETLQKTATASKTIKLTAAQQRVLERGGVQVPRGGEYAPGSTAGMIRQANTQRQLQKNTLRQLEEEFNRAKEAEKRIGLNVPTPPSTKPETEDPDDAALKKAQQDAEQAAKQEQQRRLEQAGFANDMEKISFDYRMQLSDEAFEHQKRLIDERNQYELSGLNDIQAHQMKFAQDLKKVRLDAEDAIRKAIQKTQEAQLGVVAAQRTAQAAGASSAGGMAVFGETGRTANRDPNWVHGHFQTNTASLATLIGDVVPVVKELLSQGIPVELSGGQKFNTNMSDADIASLLRKGASQHGHSGDGRSLDLFVPKGTAVPVPLSDVRNTGGRGGVTGVLPGSGQSWLGHLDPRSKSGSKQSSAAFSMDTKTQKESFDLQKQYLQSANQISLQSLQIERAIQLAKERTAVIIKSNIDSLFPVEQQKLDLRLQQMRHNLLMQGMPQEYIAYEEKRAVAAEKAAGMTATMKAENDEAKKALEEYNKQIARGVELLPSQKAQMAILNDQIKQNEQGLKDLAKAQIESNILALESAIATMKQADALKAMEETSRRIDEAVNGVTGTYKNLFKEIATGTDSVEALKKAQDALADQFLTMFFDFAMKPVEDFFKNTLGDLFKIPSEEDKRKEAIDKMQAQLDELKEHKKIQQGIKDDTAAIRNGAGGPGAAQSQVTGGFAQGFLAQAGSGLSPFLSIPGGMGAAAGLSYEGVTPATGTGMGSIGSYDWGAASENMDGALSSVVDSINKNAEEAGEGGAAGKKWQESLGKTVQGIGIAAGAIMGIMAGINQIKEGGTSNVLGGIGSILLSVGGAIGGFMNLGKAANGAVWKGGFTAFANGGTVTGPTLGLIGEGKYNEAIVPLPDGKSIPVQLGGSIRDKMGSDGMGGGSTSPVLSMSFQSTTINGVEYVDRAQLEAAMAETRRMASREGAARGANLALDKLANSPSSRRRVGLR